MTLADDLCSLDFDAMSVADLRRLDAVLPLTMLHTISTDLDPIEQALEYMAPMARAHRAPGIDPGPVLDALEAADPSTFTVAELRGIARALFRWAPPSTFAAAMTVAELERQAEPARAESP